MLRAPLLTRSRWVEAAAGGVVVVAGGKAQVCRAGGSAAAGLCHSRAPADADCVRATCPTRSRRGRRTGHIAGISPQISAHIGLYRLVTRVRPGNFFSGQGESSLRPGSRREGEGLDGNPGRCPGLALGRAFGPRVQTGQGGATWDEARGAMLRAPFPALGAGGGGASREGGGNCGGGAAATLGDGGVAATLPPDFCRALIRHRASGSPVKVVRLCLL